MPLQATSGAASYDAFGGGVAAVPNYIEEVFSTYIWTTTTSPNTIVNGIDLATKGGMVWTKIRNQSDNNRIWDSARGPTKRLITDATAAQVDEGIYGQVFNTNGFTDRWFGANYSAASWTFRKQPKFFDVVTYTGNEVAGRTVAHNLGSAPGCIIVKRTSSGANWVVYHRSLGATAGLFLNSTSAEIVGTGFWNDTEPTSTNFTLGEGSTTNGIGETYVAYIFAHNAGGFGLTGTDNVISCGSYTGNGSAAGPVVNLGYEPQWILVKGASSGAAYDWAIVDNMRGIPMSGDTPMLFPNTAAAEYAWQAHGVELNSTGFQITSTYSGVNGSGETYIYIAIRRGPMKVPTTGTSVFSANKTTSNQFVNTGFPVDLQLGQYTGGGNTYAVDRLRGMSTSTTGSFPFLFTQGTNAESTNTGSIGFNGFVQNGFSHTLGNFPQALWSFKRAPSVFDVVCYTGTGASSQVLTHNLTVAPQLTIFKKRSASNPWDVVYNNTSYLQLNDTLQALPDTSIAATSTTITAPLGAGNGLNASGATYVAYLFATCPGVSKVGSYTGTGTTQTINCGFTAGSRFVLIKRTDASGDWYVWDSARGIVAGNDPHLSLNTTAAEVTSNDTIDTDSTGFVVNQVAATNVNVNAATYIFLAVS
jgi:hypothetical protein